MKIGLLGLGVVGAGVAQTLLQKGPLFASRTGCTLEIKKILVRDIAKKRGAAVPEALLTMDAEEILGDSEIEIVIELMGGEQPAHDYICRAVSSGKHVVTANKEVLAKHGPELLSMAEAHGVSIFYEASVGGGIPLIAPFRQELIANEIHGIQAIINGTTNYILTKMSQEGLPFDIALKQAQELGYAEADPTNDVEAHDAAYKLSILATLAFRSDVRPADIYREGISRLTPKDFKYAQELGYAIKLLAIGKLNDGAIQVRVHPALVPIDLLLAKVDGVFNAVYVEGDLVGRVLFYGQGAGSLPTSSSVVANVLDLAQSLSTGATPRPNIRLDAPKALLPFGDIRTRYYLRVSVADRPGVLAQIAKVLGDHLISISSFIQKESDESAQTAEIVIMTHLAQESAMLAARTDLEKLTTVYEIGSFIRVEG
ncbi:MAG: homoserine dehydrogenase [Chloroflexota bacterium]|nr:MAG: homoserine dehydrogenase [Chloroflexota bacterium]